MPGLRYLADLCGARLLVLPGSGHAPQERIPAKMNLVIKDFIDEVTGKSLPARAASSNAAPKQTTTRRAKRTLYLSSPIGLGHARRDLATARELRQHHPDLEIDWLAQHPVTAFLESAGERIHPASHLLANESQHIETKSDGHDLHVFEAYRRMDFADCESDALAAAMGENLSKPASFKPVETYGAAHAAAMVAELP